MADQLTGDTVALLQTMIRNACVNDGTASSGQEVRNADAVVDCLDGSGIDVQRYEPTPGRTSVVARIAGRDPAAPSLCLMGHTDVVPVHQEGWSRDPFGGELIDGEVWGRGAVDMLNLTASMTVAFRRLAETGFRPRGDLILFAVADEESGSAHGAQWMADHEPDAIRADFVLTENGGLHSGMDDAPTVVINVAEKGVAWRRLRVRGTPGHGSAPFRTDNSLVKAAKVISRIADYRPPPRFHELWPQLVSTLRIDDEHRAMLLDLDRIDSYLDDHPHAPTARRLHACTHTTFSCNAIDGHGMKTNVIPDHVDIDVDIRTVPGDDDAAVRAHLNAALGDLGDQVEVEVIMRDPASMSRIDTPLWDSLQRAIAKPFPASRPVPGLVVGFTDARVYRAMGAVAYGAGLFSPDLPATDFASRFHGHDERIDVESLRLTANLWLDVVHDLMA